MYYLESRIGYRFEDSLCKKYYSSYLHGVKSLYSRLFYLYDLVDELAWSEDLYEEEPEEE